DLGQHTATFGEDGRMLTQIAPATIRGWFRPGLAQVSWGLDERVQTILRTLVESYIRDAEPIGSRTLSRMLDLDLSPATIRNAMADLSELGFLHQPHPSSGRVPTAKAYQFFLDTGALDLTLPEGVREQIETTMAGLSGELNHMLSETTRLVSGLTIFTGLVTSPRLGQARLRRIEFLRLENNRVYVVLITRSNMIHHRIIEVSEEVTQEFLSHVSQTLNHEFSGAPLSEVRQHMLESLMKEKEQYDQLLAQAVRMSKRGFDLADERELYVEGQSHLLSEFRDSGRIRGLLQALEEKTTIIDMLDQTFSSPGLQVSIGLENGPVHLEDCALVTATYGSSDRILGTIGVLGPSRMDYPRVIPVIDYMARMLTEMIVDQ
ncbi:MAG: heat-inducible transcriptional repressor HrcA, partial [Deltaproteobacteria bacterium]|nr:heat-inducible transcriptional repressor HrcA [Deltaproteobacteria bacterium]